VARSLDEYQSLATDGEVEAKELELFFLDGDDERFRAWRIGILAPWWAAMAERAGADGLEIDLLIRADNTFLDHGQQYVWPAARKRPSPRSPASPSPFAHRGRWRRFARSAGVPDRQGGFEEEQDGRLATG
jgi:hypothetical protein